MKFRVWAIIGSVILAFQSALAGGIPQRPKLILVLVIDQFRADYLMRFKDQFLPPYLNEKKTQVGGFSFLMSQSAYFPFGEYNTIQNITCPGHATILTGAYPYQNGIPNNYWYDETLRREVYCAEDVKSLLIHSKGSISKSGGRSPILLNATTVGDELKNVDYPSRVFSIALKDRSAIMLGGHQADLALWYDSSLGEWISSQYYLKESKLPDWLLRFNQELATRNQGNYEWKGKGFSYPTVSKGSEISLSTPYGISMTVDLAEKVLDQYRLGQEKRIDLLAVSFSGHDKLGHEVGPNSPLMEAMTLAEDQAFSRLLNSIKKKMPRGLKDVLIVLTADHGVAPSPDLAKEHRIDAGRASSIELANEINLQLNEQFGAPNEGEWVVYKSIFHFYLNLPAIADKKLKLAEVEKIAKGVLLRSPHVRDVLTSTEHADRRYLPGIFNFQSLHSYIPHRSGHLLAVLKPYYIDSNGITTYGSSSHISGYSYDRTVPILLFAESIRPGTYSTRAEVVDIAPTLSFLVGVIPPSMSEGRVLSEILKF